MNDAPAKNTNRELWREREGDYYAPSLFVTEGGGIGIDVGGHVIVRPIREWHRLGQSEAGKAFFDYKKEHPEPPKELTQLQRRMQSGLVDE